MKKAILIFILFVSFLNLVSAQNAYYDALFIANLDTLDFEINATSNLTSGEKEIITQLKGFYLNPEKAKIRPKIDRVKEIFQKQNEAGKLNAMASGMAGLELLSLVAPIFNLSKMNGSQVDTLLYGTTIYMANQFKKGMTDAYLKTLESTIGGSNEMKALFPQTYRKLQNFDVLRYKNFGNEIKGVFDEDLAKAPQNIIEYIDTATSSSIFPNIINIKNSKNYIYFKLASEISQKLIDGVHPSDILGFLDGKYYPISETTFSQTIKNQFHFLNIIQRNLRDTTSAKPEQFANVWINFEKYSKLKTLNAENYFWALIKLEDSTFYESTIKNNEYLVVEFLSAATRIDEFCRLKQKTISEEKVFMGFLNTVSEIVPLLIENKTDKSTLNLFVTIFELYNQIKVKNYSNTTLYLGIIINYLGANNEGLVSFLRKFDSISGFASEVVNAKTSEDINLALKQYASPPSTFMSKKESNFSAIIGGMPTGFIGSDKLRSDVGGSMAGLSLPMGIDLALGCDNKDNGLFIGLLDLGAMLNYRFSSNSNTLPDKVGFENVFSPGLTVRHGFKNSPWNLQFGYQRGAKLRKISNDKVENDLRGSDRLQLRLSYDIPLLKVFQSKDD